MSTLQLLSSSQSINPYVQHTIESIIDYNKSHIHLLQAITLSSPFFLRILVSKWDS